MERPSWGPNTDSLPLIQLCIKSLKISTEIPAALKRQNIQQFQDAKILCFLLLLLIFFSHGMNQETVPQIGFT